MCAIEVIKGAEKYSMPGASDLSPSCLTLRHLHALRKIREREAVERAEHLELIQTIYRSDTNCAEGRARGKSKKPIKTRKPFKLISPNKI